jgi:hypothetical protein
VLLGSTGVAHAGQNIAPSGNSRMHEEHFILSFLFGDLVGASYASPARDTTDSPSTPVGSQQIEHAIRLPERMLTVTFSCISPPDFLSLL